MVQLPLRICLVAALGIPMFANMHLAAQPLPEVRSLSLDDALTLALGGSEEIRIAQAGITRAEGNQMIARSGYLPQISASLSYTRTLMSQYSGLTSGGDGGGGDSSGGTPAFLQDLPFGQANQYAIGITLSQNIFTGGRLTAQSQAADARRRSADIELTTTQAQLLLDITQSYYDAMLSDQLVSIADSSLAQTETVFRQAELSFKVGAKPEFEMLRARVARDNQIPILLQRRNERAMAYNRLKQLLNVPLGDSLVLISRVEDANSRFATPSDTSADVRAGVLQAAENVRASEAGVDLARSERWPLVMLTSRFAPVAYPDEVIPTSFDDFRTDWTVGLSVSVPIFTGGRIAGNEKVAEGTLQEAQARLYQAREAASLEARSAMNDLAQAEATLRSSGSTEEQAIKAYSIAEIRFREGISTQTELTETRLLVEQARANKARAARNYQVARVKLALLRDLPLGAGGAGLAPQGMGGGGVGAFPAGADQGSTGGAPMPGGGAVPGMDPSTTGNF